MLYLVPFRVEENLPGLEEYLGAVSGAGHDGLLHHAVLPHHDGDAVIQQLCLALHQWPEYIEYIIITNTGVKF